MIARSLRLRHGRIAIARSATPILRQRIRSMIQSARQQEELRLQANEEYDPIAEEFRFKQHQRRVTGKIGAKVEPHYTPNSLAYNPPRPDEITLELLLASQTHLGHRTSLWHPANSRYIHGIWGQEHDAIHVISLDVTAAHLRRACKVVEGVAAKGGLILFVGTRDGHALPVVRAAQNAKGYHLFDKWRPGTITNAEQILGKCKTMVVNEVDQEVLGFDSQLGTRAAIKPDLVVCLNPLENYILLHECGLHNIPTIGIIDTDVNPTWVTYPIPANDDSIRSISVIAGALGKAGEAGQALRLRRARDGHVDFVPAADLTLPSREAVQQAKRLKENPELEDRDDEDEQILTAAEQEMYGHAVASQQATAELTDASAEAAEAPQEADEVLTSLTNFSEEAAPLLSQAEVTELAETIQENVETIDANAAADSAREQQIREEAPASFREVAGSSPVTQAIKDVEDLTLEAEADAVRTTARATEAVPSVDALPMEEMDEPVTAAQAHRQQQSTKKSKP